MAAEIKIAFASGTDDLNRRLIEEMRRLYPEIPLCVVSDFPPEDETLEWIRYFANRTLFENLARCRADLRGRSVRLAGVMLVPNVPFRKMRLMALMLSPLRFVAFNENLDHFMLRPRALPAIFGHAAWRLRNAVRAILKNSSSAPDIQPASEPEPDIAFFEGRAATGLPRILVASPYFPFPLSHGGAVRMFNLMHGAAAEFDQIVIAFADDLSAPAPEILGLCVEIVLVRRRGTHALPSRGRPDVVEEFDSETFRSGLVAMVRKHHPEVAQLEFTQMAQYASACAPARTILVEHDITFDLYQQQLAVREDWEVRRQLRLWRKFEEAAWRSVDCVVTMSDKDRLRVRKSRKAVTLPNGVDLNRFAPNSGTPEPRRLLFIGSFAHFPNLVALEFFLNQVWPLLENVTLHVIGGSRHEYFLNYDRDRVSLDIPISGVEIEGFVSDVRPAYRRAAIVLAPLLASAGTNIKVLEAMAMGKAVVSTPSGINGLDLTHGKDILVTETPQAMAEAIASLLADPARRGRIELEARKTVERDYGWNPIALKAAELYRNLGATQKADAPCA